MKSVVVPGEPCQAVEDLGAGLAGEGVSMTSRSVLVQFLQSLEDLAANLADQLVFIWRAKDGINRSVGSLINVVAVVKTA